MKVVAIDAKLNGIVEKTGFQYMRLLYVEVLCSLRSCTQLQPMHEWVVVDSYSIQPTARFIYILELENVVALERQMLWVLIL